MFEDPRVAASSWQPSTVLWAPILLHLPAGCTVDFKQAGASQTRTLLRVGAPPPGCPGAQTPPSALAPPSSLPLPAGSALLGVRARMAAENEASQESALGAYSPVDYMSITSFPRLPEDEPAPAAPLRGRKDEDAFLGDPDTGEALWPHPCPALRGEGGGWCPSPPPPVLSIHFHSPISFIHHLHPGPLPFSLSPANCLVGKGVFLL